MPFHFVAWWLAGHAVKAVYKYGKNRGREEEGYYRPQTLPPIDNRKDKIISDLTDTINAMKDQIKDMKISHLQDQINHLKTYTEPRWTNGPAGPRMPVPPSGQRNARFPPRSSPYSSDRRQEAPPAYPEG
jgi:hypothetical protein